MSSSLQKVRIFGNEKSTDNAGIIVKITFDRDLWDVFTIRAHQKKGVQGNASVVAVHREGFAEIGNIDSDAAAAEVKGPPRLDHNLGFTSSQAALLKKRFSKIEEIR